MKFSIIIPCYNERENIDSLIQRLLPLQDKYELEYVLVENGSKDGSKAYFEQNVEGRFSNIKLVYVTENLGYGYGLQQGLKAADGEYVGWIHADLQILPEALVPFFDYAIAHQDRQLFLKGSRFNRSLFDNFFTFGQSVFSTLLFHSLIHDVGAIPVLFSKTLFSSIEVDGSPNDFSIELFVYVQAKLQRFEIRHFKVALQKREKGKSSWNTGLRSRIRQSKRIFKDSLKIKRGEKVL